MGASQVRNTRPIDVRQGEPREPKYLKWLRTQRCAACRTGLLIEAAHTGSRGKGMGIKACDSDAIPLCGWCHRLSPRSYHNEGEERWLSLTDLDLPAIRLALRERFHESA